MKKAKQKLPKNVAERMPPELGQSDTGIIIHKNERGFIGAAAVNLVFGIILTLLSLRFVLRLLGANGENAFASMVYNLSQPLVTPFFGLFNYEAQLETARFEVATLVALLVYGVIAGVLARVLVANRHHV